MKDYEGLISLVEQMNINSFMEIGTWEGFTTLLLWLHPNILKGKTIDICTDYAGGGSGYHHGPANYGKYFKGITNIVFEVADSTKYPGEDAYDLVFIDGNHDYDYVKNDYYLAQKIATKVIVFHDYYNGNPDVDRFIDELLPTTDVYGFPGSSVVFIPVKKVVRGSRK